MIDLIIHIYFFSLPLLFVIMGIIFFQYGTIGNLKRRVSYSSWFFALISFFYIFMLIVDRIEYKIYLFNIFSLFVPVILFLMYDFALRYAKVKHYILFTIMSACFFIVTLILLIVFPFNMSAYTLNDGNWYRAMFYSHRIIPVVSMLIYGAVIFISVIFFLVRYYIKMNLIRIKKASSLLLIVFTLVYVIFSLDLYIKYYYFSLNNYYDFFLSGILFLILVVLFCEKKYFFLDIEPRGFLFDMINNLEQALVIVDEQLKITWHNEEFFKMTFSDLSSLLGVKLQDFIFKNKGNDFFTEKRKCTIKLFLPKYSTEHDITLLYTSLPVYDIDGHFIGGIYSFKNIIKFETEKSNVFKIGQALKKDIELKRNELKIINNNIKTELKKRAVLENQIFMLMSLDPLTKLYNRRYIWDKISSLIKNPHISQLAILYLDIDNFKNINDSLGHQLGDIFLQKFSLRLLNCLEDQKATIGRLGGDEFLIIIQNYQHDTKSVCMKIKDSLDTPFQITDRTISVSVSIGVSLYPEDGITVSSLVKFADIAMYNSKIKGKNNFSFFESHLKAKIEKDFFLSHRLRYAIEHNLLQVFLQPKIKIQQQDETLLDKELIGYEAVLQLKESDFGVISTENILEIAKHNGMIKSLDRWLLKEVCKKIVSMDHKSKHTMASFNISINISDRTFFDELFLYQIKDILKRYHVNPKYLGIEISEKTLMEDPKKSIHIINELRQMDIYVSVDEFGLLYSSLNYLKLFTFDSIKISQVFIKEIDTNKKDAAITNLIIKLSRSIGMDVVAEGVETEIQLNFLLKYGCHIFQGPLFEKYSFINDDDYE